MAGSDTVSLIYAASQSESNAGAYAALLSHLGFTHMKLCGANGESGPQPFAPISHLAGRCITLDDSRRDMLKYTSYTKVIAPKCWLIG